MARGVRSRSNSVIRWVVLFAVTGMLLPASIETAEIEVAGSCTLVKAIRAANRNDDAGGACPPGGSGADTLWLTSDVLLTEPSEFQDGLPIVRGPITVEGRGFTIQAVPHCCRLLTVERNGALGVCR